MEYLSEGYPEVGPLYTSATYFFDFDVPEVHKFAIDAMALLKIFRLKRPDFFTPSGTA